MHRLVDLESTATDLMNTSLGDSAEAIIDATRAVIEQRKHGDLQRWLTALNSLPDKTGVASKLASDIVTVGDQNTFDGKEHELLHSALKGLMPWRKGPYSIGGIHIDTEWHSDWKWQRLRSHISPLTDRTVLDVGCGNGYHLWRMLGDGARYALGIDPGILFAVQFAVLQRYINTQQATLLPLTLEQFPPGLACFDTVFSMGVIYHRHDPQEHIQALAGQLKSGGELVLESLVMPPGVTTLESPERYARMRNIGQIPDANTLAGWLTDGGFSEVRVVDDSQTSLEEQRTTEWMPFESLAESLQKTDQIASQTTEEATDHHRLTVEGYPAPRRAILVAKWD